MKTLGSVWTARAKVYDANGKFIGSCMDTPNAIARMFMEIRRAEVVKDVLGKYTHRIDYKSKMNEYNNVNPEWASNNKINKRGEK